ncbi:CDP-diacylglycerol--glycerol-3-phosphate 3-phosphatidyltransferase [Myxococcota bacterium]|nr:CDP-diacylglycerol--glycerol-3-phosphate 3-phosphatidyltransferase [Myxococcota bacterium]
MKQKPFGALKSVPRILTLRFRKQKKVKDYRTAKLGDEIRSLPNVITMSRLFMIPGIIYFLRLGTVRGHYFAALLFLFAGISDGLDGYLARRSGKITLLGKFLDPLADKLTTLSIMVYLVMMTLVPPWLLILMLFREFSITGLRAIAIGEGVVISASQSGKAKTAFQFVGLTFLLVHNSYSFIGTDFILDYHKMGLYILYLSLIMSIFSAFEYFALFVEAAEQKDIKQKKMLELAALEAGLPASLVGDLQQEVVEEQTVEVDLSTDESEAGGQSPPAGEPPSPHIT